MSEVERLGQRLARPAKQQATAIVIRWGIVRVIDDPADLTIWVEFAREGRYCDGGGDPMLDYGRWVGEHEYMRTDTDPPSPIPPIDDYLHKVKLLPHTVADDYDYFLWPHAEDPEHPDSYRDTHIDDTDLVMLLGPPGDLLAIPIARMWRKRIDTVARHHDCIVEDAEE